MQGDCDTATGCWIGHYDTFDSVTDEYISSGDDQQDCTGDCCAGIDGEGVNPFQVFSGNVTRKVQDLEVKGAAHGKFGFTRHHNTIGREGIAYFGVGGSWRHNWQFDLVEHPTGENSRPALELVYPSGTRRYFGPLASGGWAAEALHAEKINVTVDGFDITTGQGTRMHFVTKTSSAGNRYEMQTLTDTFGLATHLVYNSQGYLTQVTEAAGRQLVLAYKTVPFKQGLWTRVGAIQTVPAPNQWIELTVTPVLQTSSTQYIRLRAQQAGGSIDLAEIQFLSPSNAVLRGTFTGTNDQSDKPMTTAAFCDGNPATASLGMRVCLLDLGTGGKGAVGKIRVLAAVGRESSLNGAIIEVLQAKDGVRTVLDHVTGSDGHTVSYAYQTAVEPATGYEFAVLNQAQYGDGTAAHYSYDWVKNDPRPILRPLLVEADDARYDGPAKRIRYAYHDQLGMIHQEINPATGGVYASLELDPANPDKRTVNYSDLRSVSYVVPKSTNGRPTERTDGLGRKTAFEYADGGAGRLVAQTDHVGRRTTFTYDAGGRVTSHQRDAKVIQQHTFDSAGRKLKTTDQFGKETSLERDGNGRVTLVHSPDGTVHNFTYDALGRVVSFSQVDGGLHKFVYDTQGRKASWTNPRGGVTQYGYDTAGRVISVTDPLGRTSRRGRNERGLLTKFTHSDGTTRQFAYDAYGRKIAETDQLGRTTKLTYDDLGRVIRQEDHAGRVTTFDYTQLPGSQGCGSCILVDKPSRIVQHDGTVIQRLYDTENRLVAQTVAVGAPTQATTTYGYDNDDNLTTVTDPLGRVSRYTYDDQHHNLSAADPSGRTIQEAYDAQGHIVSIALPGGGIVKNDYDSAGRRTARTDATGHVTRYAYDAMGNIKQLIDAAGQKFSTIYDGKRRTALTYPDGKRQSWSYDAVGRVTKSTSPDGVETTVTYDAGNRVLSTADTLGHKMEYSYDSLGHRLSALDGLGRATRWSYDAHGNILTTTRPDGIVVRNTYDAQDHLLTTTDAAGAITSYTYDAAGNQLSLTDANGKTYRFTYDALRHKTSMIYPDVSEEKWTYDLAGNLVTSINRAGQTKTIIYNASNQPVSETWSPAGAAPNVAYRYDTAGRLISTDNGNAKLTYAYDDRGLLASETSDLSAIVPGLDSHTIKYNYDELGRRSDLIYPDRTDVSYAYDARNRIITIDTNGGGRAPLATYDYNPLGQIAKLTRDSGIATAYTYDMAERLTDITHARAGTMIANSRYTLDQLGRRTAQTHEDGISENYSYDATGQLTSADYGTSSAGRETFDYDPTGNRTATTFLAAGSPVSATTYTTNSLNQYTRLNVGSLHTPLIYDSNGNLTDDGRQSYRYDGQNRLLSVEPSTAQIVPTSGDSKTDFFYDPKGRCILRKVYSRGSQGHWNLATADSRALTYDNWNLLAERKLDGSSAARYVQGLRVDEILVSLVGSQTLYPLTDALGSTIAIANKQGELIERIRYNVSGKPSFLSSSYQARSISVTGYCFLYTGREWLASTGIYNYRNRAYSAILGRFLQTDPLRFGARDVNLYRYTINSFVNTRDPYGMCCEGLASAMLAAMGPVLAADRDVNSAQAAYDSASGAFQDAVSYAIWTTAAAVMATGAAEACWVSVLFTAGATIPVCIGLSATALLADGFNQQAIAAAERASVAFDIAGSALYSAVEARKSAEDVLFARYDEWQACVEINSGRLAGCPCK